MKKRIDPDAKKSGRAQSRFPQIANPAEFGFCSHSFPDRDLSLPFSSFYTQKFQMTKMHKIGALLVILKIAYALYIGKNNFLRYVSQVDVTDLINVNLNTFTWMDVDQQ